jgi:hypothetical protein
MTKPNEIAELVERLRAHLCDNEVYHPMVCTEAASALEQLSAEYSTLHKCNARIAELEWTLKCIAGFDPNDGAAQEILRKIVKNARAALKEQG